MLRILWREHVKKEKVLGRGTMKKLLLTIRMRQLKFCRCNGERRIGKFNTYEINRKYSGMCLRGLNLILKLIYPFQKD